AARGDSSQHRAHHRPDYRAALARRREVASARRLLNRRRRRRGRDVHLLPHHPGLQRDLARGGRHGRLHDRLRAPGAPSMRVLVSLCLAATVVGCGAPGSLVFTTYGEDFIEKGIPVEDFEDGWSVTFSKFLVGIGEIKVVATDGTQGASLPEVKL